MAKIIVARDQQAEMRRLYPKPAYSRWISLQVWVPPDSTAYNYTEVVGQTCWLLGVKVWVMPKAVVDPTKTTSMWITTGTTIPKTFEEVMNWERILPIVAYERTHGLWICWDGMPGFEWEMEMLYTGLARRFGCAVHRIGADYDTVQISFKISEG